MKALLRTIAVLAAVSTAACASAPVHHHLGERPMRPTIELLARSVSFDAPGTVDLRGDATVNLTLNLVGEHLMDYARQGGVPVTSTGAAPAVAYFAPPDFHGCCWQPSALVLARAGATPPSGIAIPATVDEEAPADLDVDRSAPKLQPLGVALPAIERATLPAGDVAKLERSGVTGGSPAVAIVDVGDPGAPFVVGLRAPDARELASDPAQPPTTADLSDRVPRASGRCAHHAIPMPDRFAHTLSAIGPVFFHRPIATPRDVPKGRISMTWAVLGPDHVRALFASSSRGCKQDVLLDIEPASHLIVGRDLHHRRSRLGKLYRSSSGRRSVLVYDKIAYDVRGASPFATHVLAGGLVPDPVVADGSTNQ